MRILCLQPALHGRHPRRLLVSGSRAIAIGSRAAQIFGHTQGTGKPLFRVRLLEQFFNSISFNICLGERRDGIQQMLYVRSQLDADARLG